MEENDLQETANEIAKNLDDIIKNQSIYHVLKDFYHLIKRKILYLTKLNNIIPLEEINIMKKSFQIGLKSV